jgi:Ca-activated chloride channel family protein
VRQLSRHLAIRIIPLATLGSLAITLAAARPAAPPSERVTIILGTVRTATGDPVPGATIDARVGPAPGPRTVSDAAGRYRLTLPHPNASVNAIVRARCPGFEQRELRVLLQGDTARVDLVITPTGDVLGPARVTAVATGAAVSAALSGVGVVAAPAPRGRRESGGQARAKLHPGTTSLAAATVLLRPRHHPMQANDTEGYEHLVDNPFRSPRVAALSTFSVDVDRASYANVRRYLASGNLPPADAVRLEELVNYFPYDDPAPRAGEPPVRISTEVAAAPWNPSHDLVRIALRARDVDMRHAPASNLVFLIDVSGSMMGPGRLPLVKESLALLVHQMREEDRIAIVVYAGNAGLVLPSTSGEDKSTILAALDRLEAGGSTAGGAGIALAYDVARQHFIRSGTNRVILCTDGDFNVGPSSDGAMVRLIEQRRAEGSYLTILGFGMGNYQDAKMEKLAGAGNGNYAYIDDLLEARKMLVREMGGTLVTVAKDVKLQVEFNPERVQAYRLLGYEDRLLRDEDFTDDARDAGDVGAGHTVTVLYEIVRSDQPLDVALPDVRPLRYQHGARVSPSDELLHVAMRYKAPDGDRSMLLTQPVRAPRAGDEPSRSMRFASAVAGFAMLLRHSPEAGSLEWHDVITLASGAQGTDEDGYRAEFVRLATTAARLSAPLATRERRRDELSRDDAPVHGSRTAPGRRPPQVRSPVASSSTTAVPSPHD